MATHADISGNLTIGPLQSVRRNADNTTFEAYTTSSEVNYLVYAALLTQSGTVAPVASVLQNTLGADVVWSRSNNGQYAAVLTGMLWPGNTFILLSVSTGIGASGASFLFAGRNEPSDGMQIDVVTAYLSVLPPPSIEQTDGLLNSTAIEFRLYMTRMRGAARGTASAVASLAGAGRATTAAGTSTVSGTLSSSRSARGTAAGTSGGRLNSGSPVRGVAAGTSTARLMSASARGVAQGIATASGTLTA